MYYHQIIKFCSSNSWHAATIPAGEDELPACSPIQLAPSSAASAAAQSRADAIDAAFISIVVQSGWIRLLGDVERERHPRRVDDDGGARPSICRSAA